MVVFCLNFRNQLMLCNFLLLILVKYEKCKHIKGKMANNGSYSKMEYCMFSLTTAWCGTHAGLLSKWISMKNIK